MKIKENVMNTNNNKKTITKRLLFQRPPIKNHNHYQNART